MLHEPAAKQGRDPASGYKSRVGVWMFVVYASIYAGFVAINLLAPQAMEETFLAGMNLAVVYGFGLIVFALLLSGVYNTMCNREEKRLEGTGGEGE